MSKIAYGVYTYTGGENDAKGKIGVAEYANSVINRTAVKDLDRQDPKEFYFETPAGEKRVLLAGTQYDPNYNPQDGLFAVYDENLSPVGDSFTTPDVVNLYAFVGPVAGKYYGIDYDLHKVVRFTLTDKGGVALDSTASFEFIPLASQGKGYGVDLATDGEQVYALFATATDPFAGKYTGYTLIRLDQDLQIKARTDVKDEKNPFSLDLYNGDLYVTVLGGAQEYGKTNGAASKIQKVTAAFGNGATVATLLVGGADAAQGDFRALSFTAAGEAYILTGRYNSDAESFDGAVHYTTAAALNAAGEKTIDTISKAKYSITKVKGYTWGLFYSKTDNVLWAAQGNNLGVYEYDEVDKKLNQNGLATIIKLADNDVYSLNSAALLEAGGQVKGYVSPALASVSKAARLEREKLFKK